MDERIRIRLTKANGRELMISGFLTMLGAARLGGDLAMDPDITMVAVEREHPWRGWEQMWVRWQESAR